MKDSERNIGFLSLNERNKSDSVRSGEVIIADQSGSTLITQLKSALDYCLEQTPSAENDVNIDFLRELIDKATRSESSLFTENENGNQIIAIKFSK